MLEHRDVAAHPRMHVALDGNCDLLPRKGFFQRRARGLRFIPFAVVDWNGMDIVCCAVIIHDANFLLSLKPDDGRQIHASFLVHLYRFSRYVEGAVAKPLRNKNDHVTERASASRHVFFVDTGPGMRLGATRVSGHTNAIGCSHPTLDPDPASHRTPRVAVGLGQTPTAKARKYRAKTKH